MKIDFIIRDGSKGDQNVYVSNPKATWGSSIFDLRAAIQKSNINANEVLYGVRYIENGVLVIAGYFSPSDRGNEYTAAWMFIPAQILMSLTDNVIYDRLQKLVKIISLPDLDFGNDKSRADFEKKCNELKKNEFNTDHAQTVAPTLAPSAKVGDANGYGICVCKGTDELKKHLLAKFLYQSDYAKYIAVFFADKKDLRAEPTAHNISDLKLKENVVVQFTGFPSDVTIMVDNGALPKGATSCLATVGQQLKLKFTRPGLVSKTLDLTVRTDSKVSYDQFKSWTVRASADNFVVTDERGRKINGAQFRIKGAQDGRSVSEEGAKAAEVTITAQGYEESTIIVNLLTQPMVHVALRPRMQENTYRLPLKNGDFAEFTIEERESEKPKSPVLGYNVSSKEANKDDAIVLERPGNAKQFMIISAVLGFAIGALCMLCVWWIFGGKSDDKPAAAPKTEQTTTPPVQATDDIIDLTNEEDPTLTEGKGENGGTDANAGNGTNGANPDGNTATDGAPLQGNTNPQGK